MQGKKEEEKETEGNKHFFQSYQTTQVSKKPLFISLNHHYKSTSGNTERFTSFLVKDNNLIFNLIQGIEKT